MDDSDELTKKNYRVAAFSYLHAAALVAETLTVPISAFLMTVNPWIPFLMGPAVMVIIILLTMTFYLVPEQMMKTSPLTLLTIQRLPLRIAMQTWKPP
jgi:hypothetical protein